MIGGSGMHSGILTLLKYTPENIKSQEQKPEKYETLLNCNISYCIQFTVYSLRRGN
jgi:hypothetical protein